ncbi:MAG: hypothetical protein ACFFDN_17645 [Candidatus Hodarchaeota archaeon]
MKTKTRRMPKKSKLQKKKDNPNSGYWMRQCDKIFGLIYHSKYTKKICSIGHLETKADKCSGNIEMAHLIERENYLWRWNFDNVIDLCSHHHKFSRIISSHNAPIAFSQFLYKYFPDKWEFVNQHKWESVTRKVELLWTFQSKYYELLHLAIILKLDI